MQETTFEQLLDSYTYAYNELAEYLECHHLNVDKLIQLDGFVEQLIWFYFGQEKT